MTKEKAVLGSNKIKIMKEIWLVYDEGTKRTEYFPTKEEAHMHVTTFMPVIELEETVSGGWCDYDSGITIMPELVEVEGL